MLSGVPVPDVRHRKWSSHTIFACIVFLSDLYTKPMAKNFSPIRSSNHCKISCDSYSYPTTVLTDSKPRRFDELGRTLSCDSNYNYSGPILGVTVSYIVCPIQTFSQPTLLWHILHYLNFHWCILSNRNAYQNVWGTESLKNDLIIVRDSLHMCTNPRDHIIHWNAISDFNADLFLWFRMRP